MIVLGTLSLAWLSVSLFPLKSEKVTYCPGLRSLRCRVPLSDCSTCQDAVEKHVEAWGCVREGIMCLPYGNPSAAAVVRAAGESCSVGSQQSGVCCWCVGFEADLSWARIRPQRGTC